MKKLMVSYDCGLSYGRLMESESVDELLERTKPRDNALDDISWCRWYIEDEDGQIDMEHLSPVHQKILGTIKAFADKNQEESCST